MGLSTWIPNCNQAKSLIFLPFRTLVSVCKASPISQGDTCQLASCISQNKTPLEINHPTFPHVFPKYPFVFQYFVKISLLHDGADIYKSAITFNSETSSRVSERTPDLIKGKTSVSNWERVPFLSLLLHGMQGLPEYVVPLQQKLPVTTLDDDDDGDDGGARTRKGGRKWPHNATLRNYIKCHNSNFVSQSTPLSNVTPNGLSPQLLRCDLCRPTHVNIFVYYLNGFI